MLTLADMANNHHDDGQVLYSFIMTDDKWQIIYYQCEIFILTYWFSVMFPNIALQEPEWLKELAIIIDCVIIALKCWGSGV